MGGVSVSAARTAADVPELVEAATAAVVAADGDRPTPNRAACAALSVVPAPLRPIDPDDDEQMAAVLRTTEQVYEHADLAEAILMTLRDLGVGIPQRTEPSEEAVSAAVDHWYEVTAHSYRGDGADEEWMRAVLRTAYAVDGAR